MPPLSRTVRAAGVSFVTATLALAAESSPGLPKNSPFMPAAAESTAAQPTDRIEFAGVSAVGKKVDVIFFDKNAKKNIWVPVGETKDGITVVSYDERRDQVTVKFDGTQKILSLRKVAKSQTGPGRSVTPLPAASGFNVPAPLPTVLPAAAPATASTPPATPEVSPTATPPPPATPEAQATQKAETEARMLVSDLLEIGMAQRRAYEDAQRRAADPNAKNAPAQPPATPGATPPGTP